MTLKTASVLAFERKLDPSDALFFAGAWDSRNNSSAWPSVAIESKSVRGTISNRLKTKDQDAAKLDAAIENPNLQTVDVAALPWQADTLKVVFTLRVLSGTGHPSACNDADYQKKLVDTVAGYVSSQGFGELARRYAANLANGRFLWRNRVGAESVEVQVAHLVNGQAQKTWIFDALAFSLRSFDVPAGASTALGELSALIADGLAGDGPLAVGGNVLFATFLDLDQVHAERRLDNRADLVNLQRIHRLRPVQGDAGHGSARFAQQHRFVAHVTAPPSRRRAAARQERGANQWPLSHRMRSAAAGPRVAAGPQEGLAHGSRTARLTAIRRGKDTGSVTLSQPADGAEPVSLRCQLGYPDLETFIVSYGHNLSAGGLFLPALAGSLCGASGLPGWAAMGLAVAVSVWLMGRLRCIHPPGGAMALVMTLATLQGAPLALGLALLLDHTWLEHLVSNFFVNMWLHELGHAAIAWLSGYYALLLPFVTFTYNQEKSLLTSAIVALFLYSLLPIVRGTATGLLEIPGTLRESAVALGLSGPAQLFQIELPLSARSILAGIKTAAVINVGTATIGALIGAGGFGQPILVGIRRDDLPTILEGAVPAALLALLVQGAFDVLERFVLPAGLRTANEPER